MYQSVSPLSAALNYFSASLLAFSFGFTIASAIHGVRFRGQKALVAGQVLCLLFNFAVALNVIK